MGRPFEIGFRFSETRKHATTHAVTTREYTRAGAQWLNCPRCFHTPHVFNRKTKKLQDFGQSFSAFLLFPQMNREGAPSLNFGLTIKAIPILLKALTKWASGIPAFGAMKNQGAARAAPFLFSGA
jgi:hypothetical protein